jgi:hypothetical protein
VSHQITTDAEGFVVDVKRTDKRCRLCNQVKPLTAFTTYGLSKDGYYHDCKACKAKLKANLKTLGMSTSIDARRIAPTIAAEPANGVVRTDILQSTLPHAVDASRRVVERPATSGKTTVIALLDLIVTELTDDERARLLRLLQAYE